MRIRLYVAVAIAFGLICLVVTGYWLAAFVDRVARGNGGARVGRTLIDKYSCSTRVHMTSWGPVRHLVVKRRDGKSGISWDDLQALKDEHLGKDVHAIEFYPSHDQIVNEINARHLWELPDGHLPPFGFFRL